MTVDEALETYFKAYNIDATYMSHAEKIGRIYRKGFESGMEMTVGRALEIIDSEENQTNVGMAEQYKRGYTDAIRFIRQRIERLKDGEA